MFAGFPLRHSEIEEKEEKKKKVCVCMVQGGVSVACLMVRKHQSLWSRGCVSVRVTGRDETRVSEVGRVCVFVWLSLAQTGFRVCVLVDSHFYTDVCI